MTPAQLTASHDELTGLATRDWFDRTLAGEWKRNERARLPLSVVLVSFDCFEQYQDALGREAAEECLRTVAQTIAHAVRRPGDVSARFDDGTVGVLLPHTDEQGALRLAEEFRFQANALVLRHPRSSVSRFVTVSAGAAAMVPDRNGSPESLVEEALAALQRATAQGGDTVCLASTVPAVA